MEIFNFMLGLEDLQREQIKLCRDDMLTPDLAKLERMMLING